MDATTTQPVDDVERLRHDEAGELAAAVNDQLLALLADVDPARWDTPTVCTGWTVDDMVGHLIGACRSMLSLREMLRQQRHGRRHAAEFGGSALDAFNQLQVDDHRHLSPAEKLATLADLAPRAARKRTSLPAPLRAIKVPNPPGGSVPQGAMTGFTLGHLNDVLYTRDAWLHRVDIAAAVGIDARLDSDADRRLLADVVREWADRHGQPFTLHLDGPAGGRWHRGTGGPQLATAPEAFLFAVTHRAPAEGLLATHVMF